MDGPRVVTQCSKSERERKIPYDTSFMWSLKKLAQVNLFAKWRVTDMENKLMVTQGNGG